MTATKRTRVIQSRPEEEINFADEFPLPAPRTPMRYGKTPSWSKLTSRDNCYRALRAVATNPHGNTAGIDGVRPYDLSPRLCGTAAAMLSHDLRSGHYTPAPLLRRQFPKANGKMRDIDIPTVVDRAADRVISWALREAIANKLVALSWSERDEIDEWIECGRDSPQTLAEAEEALGPGITDSVYAVTGHGTREALADLAIAIEQGGCVFVGNHDIKDAYPSMPIEACLDALDELGVYENPWFGDWDRIASRTAPAAHARKAVRAILTNNRRLTRGLPQGLTCSEVALDALLHFDHDLPAREILKEGRMLRFRDNLVHAAPSLPLIARAEAATAKALKCLGAELKADEPGHGLFDLRSGAAIPVLGLQISLFEHQTGQTQVRFDLPTGWHQPLRELISSAYETPDPATTVHGRIQSWISATAPAIRNTTDLNHVLDSELQRHGFIEVKAKQFKGHIERSTSQWEDFKASRSSLYDLECS